MDETKRTGYDAARPLHNKSFRAGCHAPFTSLYLTPKGDAIACCRNQSYVLGNVATHSLDEIWNGEAIRKLRGHLVDYQFGGGCEFCGWMIDAGDHAGAMTHFFDRFAVEDHEPGFRGGDVPQADRVLDQQHLQLRLCAVLWRVVVPDPRWPRGAAAATQALR
jgi:hypothetical protein